MSNRHIVEVQRNSRNFTPVVPWKNSSDEEIPAFAVVHMRGAVSNGVAVANKPDARYGLFFANGPLPVAADKVGESLLWDRPRRVLVNGLVAVGQEVGPVVGQWYMSSSGAGFRIVHQPDGGVATVLPTTSEKPAPVEVEGSCGCDCVEQYDLIIQQDDPTLPPIQTVRRWNVEYKEPVEVLVGQYLVTLPPGVYALIWRTAQEDWFLNIGDYLTAKDLQGNDVTSSLLLDGTLTLFLPDPGEQSALNLCIGVEGSVVTPPGY